MQTFQLIVVGGDSWESAFGASAVIYEDPFGNEGKYFAPNCYNQNNNHPQKLNEKSLIHPIFLEKAFGLGKRIAKISLTLKKGSLL